MRSKSTPASSVSRSIMAGLLMACAVSAATVTGASADDLIVMPYRCDMAGGRPVLSPSEQQGHAIIGRREQRNITICSPADPGRCRTWTAHRFEISCGGVPVPWAAVVASAPQARDGRAYLEGGRLRLRMPPAWSMEPGDPCARPLEQDPRGGNGGLSRYCADRRALSPPAFVEMPAGFAPMLGLDGIFVANGAAPPQPPQPPRPDGGPALSWKATPQAAAPSVPQAAQAIQPSLKKKRPDPELVPPPAPSAAPGVAQSPAPSPPRETKLAAAPPLPGATADRPPAQASTQGSAPLPMVPPPAPAATAPEPSAPMAVVPPTPPTPPVPVSQESALRETSVGTQMAQSPDLPASQTAPQTGPLPGPQINPASSRPMKIAGSEGHSSWLGLAVAAGLALAASAAIVWFRRPRQPAKAAPFERDYAAFDPPLAPGAATGNAPPHDEDLSFALTIPQRHVPPAATGPAPSPPAVWPTDVPRTRDDALQILGMGVNAQASETALKKIVDGLRLTWHPDHALTEADRATRELRMRQINAAWDLIAGHDQPKAIEAG